MRLNQRSSCEILEPGQNFNETRMSIISLSQKSQNKWAQRELSRVNLGAAWGQTALWWPKGVTADLILPMLRKPCLFNRTRASLSIVPQMVYKHQCLLLRIYSLIKVNRNQVMNMVVFSQGSLEKTTALLQVFLECFCLCSGGNGDFRAAMLLN